MPHITLPDGVPGILGPMLFRPETAKPLNALAEVLLRGPNSLAAADREMIANYVSSQNDCYFCQHAHGAVAAYRLGGNEKLVNDVKLNFDIGQAEDAVGYRWKSADGRQASHERRHSSRSRLHTYRAHRKSVPSPHRNAARRPERRTKQHRTQISVRGL